MRAARNSCSKGNIDHSNSALEATDKIYVYILRSKCGKTLELFSIKGVRFVTNSKQKCAGSNRQDVYILRSKCGKTPEMFSIKRVRFVILARKGISIIAIARWQQQTRYVYILRSKRGKTPEMFSIKRVPLVI